MWHGFIGQRISDSTRALRRTGGALLGISLLLIFPGAKSLLNVLEGPAELNETKLQSSASGAIGIRNYVRVRGRNTTPTGIAEIRTTTRNGNVESEAEVGEYMAMVVGEHVLLVEAQPNDRRNSYVGGLRELSSDLREEFFSKVSDPQLRSATFPLLLDATGSYYEDLLWFAPVLVGFGLGMWFLKKSSKQQDAPETHPICKSLSAYGSLFSVVPEIDGEILAGAWTCGGATFTKNWIVRCWMMRADVIRRGEIVWVYRKEIKRRVHFVPAGRTISAVIRDSKGRSVDISGTAEKVDSILEEVLRSQPWVIAGYNKDLEKQYRTELQTFVAEVARRKVALP